MNSFKRLFLNEIFIITIILLYSVIIFLEGFSRLSIDLKLISNLHYLFLIIYVFELIFKINEYGFKNYIKEGLNKLDFVLVLISIPELITIFVEINITDFSFLFTLRSMNLKQF